MRERLRSNLRRKSDGGVIRLELGYDNEQSVDGLSFLVRGRYFTDLRALPDLPIAAVDIESTGVRDLTRVLDMPLEVVNVSRTAVADLAPLRGKELRSLAFDSTRMMWLVWRRCGIIRHWND